MERENKIKEKQLLSTDMSLLPNTQRQILLLVAVSLILMPTLSYSASPVTISSTRTVLVKGTTGEIDIKIDEVPKGLSGYKLKVELADKGKADITNIEHKSLGNSWTKKDKLSEDRYSISAMDYPEQVNPGDKDIKLVSIELKAIQKGSTKLKLEVKRLDNDQGGKIDYEVDEGLIDVIGEKDWSKVSSQSAGPPQDPDGDGLFEDVDGDDERTFADAVMLYNELNNPLIQSYKDLFDLNQDGEVDRVDAIALAFL